MPPSTRHHGLQLDMSMVFSPSQRSGTSRYVFVGSWSYRSSRSQSHELLIQAAGVILHFGYIFRHVRSSMRPRESESYWSCSSAKPGIMTTETGKSCYVDAGSCQYAVIAMGRRPRRQRHARTTERL